ncbi:dehydrosqualene desaturase [Capsulimonas corticalis]|uniref:Dehydrosqualene desaturase n=1 Tax=Capsulimonas corticalis TaxID=2219043 RepID=A0A402D205_9BACT|nr:phytoene desaturase family protein [Capsulimonas corticalis]BDI30111.1 dehydrosqualene desaturase [Capsulimonas corticalis]
MSQKKVVIVGAGIGGLATAMRLQARGGFSVTVLEKNAAAGGRCNIWESEGYRFDTGPSLLLMTDIYRELFAFCGADFDALVPLIKMEPNYGVHFGDGSFMTMSSDLPTMIAELERIEPGSAAGYYRFLEDASRKYRLGRSEFVEKDFRTAGDFFTAHNLGLLKKLNALDKLYTHVSQFFKDDRLRQAFSMQSMYLGISPFDAPAVYTLLPYTELAEDGLYYPKGGLYTLPRAMVQVCGDLGVEIRTEQTVQEIVVRDGKAVGVRVGGEVIPADIVISNADLPYTYTDLLEARPKRYEEASWRKQAFTSSAFVMYLGTDRRYPALHHHNFYLSSDYKRNFEEIFDAKVAPRDPSFYINAPGRTDPSVAPEGGDNLFVLVPIPHLTKQQQWTDDQIAQFREKVFDRLEARGLTDLRKHVVVERMVTPHDWERLYRLKFGAAFGLSHGIFQVGYFRPANKAPHVGNLYFVGASTAPGTGVPLVCLGAKLVSERIAADAA